MPQDKALKARVRHLRTHQTPAETRLWHHLRAKRFGDLKFTRQVAIGPYIVDFAARSRKILIEIDGDTHGGQVEYDARRTSYLAEQGFRVIRFTNRDVMENVEGVLRAVGEALGVSVSPLPGPLPNGERE